MPSAADDLLPILALAPLAVESMDSHLVDVVRSHRGASAVPELPAGGGWLFVETAGDTPADAVAAAERSARRRMRWPAGCFRPARRPARCGGSGRTASDSPAGPPPASPPGPVGRTPRSRRHQLGAYLRDFEALKAEHGVAGLSYGHFGDGCVHTRLDLPLAHAPHGSGRSSPMPPRWSSGTAGHCPENTETARRAASFCR